MNPKQQLSQLDPKLQETYNRVMGTQVSPSTPQAPIPQSPTPIEEPVPQPEPSAPIPQPVVPTPPTPSEDTMTATIAVTPTASKSGSPTGFVASVPQSKKHISPILLILGAIVFFAVYAFVWTKIFNLKIPFLPQL